MFDLSKKNKTATWDEDHLQLFKSLIDQSNDAIFIVCPNSAQVLFCNEKACRNLGYEKEEMLKKKVYDFAQNVTSTNDWRELVENLTDNDSLLFESGQRRKDGSILPVEVNVRITEHQGQLFIVSIVRDITTRKESEALLISELSNLESFMSALDDGIAVLDDNFKILYQNEAHQKMAGEHNGAFCYKAFHGKEEVCEGCLVIKTQADGRIHKRETSMITDKGKIHLEIIAYPVKNSDGKIYATAEVVRNVTKRKEGEEVLRNTAQARKQFISTAAHELGTPLSAILGYAELLNKQEEFGSFDKKQQNEFIDVIHSKALALTDIVDNLLDISRIDAGRPIRVNKTLCDLTATLQSMVKSYNNLFPKHFFSLELPDRGLQPLWVEEEKISQILENLFTNAVKYSPAGGCIKLAVEETDKEHLFILSDEGIGMDDEQIGRIFEPFYRAVADDPEIGGLGLGMSIVKQIIDGHRGWIKVERNQPKGLKVNFGLPRKMQSS